MCQVSDTKPVTRAIARDPETMHGVPVFRGTRVPVQTLFDYLEGGETLEDFLQGFPTVSRALALEALAEARKLLLSSPHEASDRRMHRRAATASVSRPRTRNRPVR